MQVVVPLGEVSPCVFEACLTGAPDVGDGTRAVVLEVAVVGVDAWADVDVDTVGDVEVVATEATGPADLPFPEQAPTTSKPARTIALRLRRFLDPPAVLVLKFGIALLLRDALKRFEAGVELGQCVGWQGVEDGAVIDIREVVGGVLIWTYAVVVGGS